MHAIRRKDERVFPLSQHSIILDTFSLDGVRDKCVMALFLFSVLELALTCFLPIHEFGNNKNTEGIHYFCMCEAIELFLGLISLKWGFFTDQLFSLLLLSDSRIQLVALSCVLPIDADVQTLMERQVQVLAACSQ